MIAPRDERGTRRTTQGGGVKFVVAKSLRRKSVHRRGRDSPAEGAELPEAGVVNQDEDDVGRTLRCLYGLRKLRRIGVLVGASDVATESRVWPREFVRRLRRWRLRRGWLLRVKTGEQADEEHRQTQCS